MFDNVIVLDVNPAVEASRRNYRTGIRSRSGYCAGNQSFFGTIVLNVPRDISDLGYRGYELAVASCDHCIAWDIGAGGFVQSRWEEGYHLDNVTVGQAGGAAIDLNNMSLDNELVDPTIRFLPESGGPAGATIINRYEDGVLTDVPLWPWPHQDRLMADMYDPSFQLPTGDALEPRGFCLAGSLTEYIWEYLGSPCPSSIRGR